MKHPMSRLRLLAQLLLGWLILQSCTCSQHHVYYSPPPQNVPLLTDSGEVNITAGLCVRDGQSFVFLNDADNYGTSGFFAQGSYSPRKNWGLTANVMQVSKTRTCSVTTPSSYENSSGTGKGYAFDLGIGYYNNVNLIFPGATRPERLEHFVFDAYAGIGQSTQRHTYQDSIYIGSSKLDAFVFYVQPSIGIKTRFFIIAASCRVNSFYFYNIDTHVPSDYPGSAYASEEINNINFISSNRLQPFLEPAITIRAGYRWVMLQFQYVYSQPFRNMKTSSYEDTKLVFGINVNIPGK